MPNPRSTTVRLRPGLADQLGATLRGGDVAVDDLHDLADAVPLDERDELLAVLTLHDLHVAPVDELGEAVALQHHPTLAGLRWRLDRAFEARLDAVVDAPADDADDAAAAVRAIATVDRVPAVYDWLADEATGEEVVAYLSLEGGPDGGFDDLVALCQVGLSGEPKLELARNYWDEMGRGTLAEVHTELHRGLSRALAMAPVPRADQPVAALQRSALGSLLATNRRLQPEMVGALGLIELQAGPRCRRVVKALRRIGAPEGAFPFYTEHAEVDPRHGKDWVDNVITPLAADPRWAAGIVRGARWRAAVDRRFLTEVGDALAAGSSARSASHREGQRLAS